MPTIKWRDSLSVGVDSIDADHKKLLTIVNEMFEAVRDQKGSEHITIQVDKLIQYTQEHFVAEEAAMAKVHYPALDAHKRSHEKLIQEVAKFKERIDNSEEDTVIPFYHFLRDWLLDHILEEDMKYKPFLAGFDDVATAA